MAELEAMNRLHDFTTRLLATSPNAAKNRRQPASGGEAPSRAFRMPATTTFTVLIADDRPLVREGLTALINRRVFKVKNVPNTPLS